MKLNIHLPTPAEAIPVMLVLWHKHTRHTPSGHVQSAEWLPFSNVKQSIQAWTLTFPAGLPDGFKLLPVD